MLVVDEILWVFIRGGVMDGNHLEFASRHVVDESVAHFCGCVCNG